MILTDNFLVPLALVLGTGLVILLAVYNVIAGILFLRESIDGNASTMAKAAWALSALALGLWCVPCVGLGAAFLALILARIERQRIYDSRAPLASATPIRMARINGRWSLAVQGVGVLAIAIGELMTG